MIRASIALILGLIILSQTTSAISETTKQEQIIALKKRIEELKKEVRKAERNYEESLSISFDQYMDTVKGASGKKMEGKVHVMRDKMDYAEEKFMIKKKFKELKEELKGAESRLMVLQA